MILDKLIIELKTIELKQEEQGYVNSWEQVIEMHAYSHHDYHFLWLLSDKYSVGFV